MRSPLIALAVLAASSVALAESHPLYFPPADGTWEAIAPAEAGFDADALDAVAAHVESVHSSALLVLHHGRILLERHWRIEPDSEHSSGTYQRMLKGYTDEGHAIEDVASAQKSVTAFLAGIAVTSDRLSLDDPVSVYLDDGWSNATPAQERAITIRHLMTMTSGLTEGLSYTDAPGTDWDYNTGAYSQMIRVLESIFSKSINEITSELLKDRVGMTNSSWRSRGGRVTSNNVGFTTTARDLARLGIVISANGSWDGERLGISQAYLDTMLSPSQDLNQNYGLLWWLSGKPPNLKPGELYRAIPYAPEDMVAAIGALGRILHVSKSEGLIAVRLGNQPPRGFDVEMWRLLMEAKTK